MRSLIIATCLLVFTAFQTSNVFAKELSEFQAEADQYYDEGNFKKAYKGYLKVAKIGDPYSQFKVSYMFSSGQGRKVDLEDAYAWSVLAAEGGDDRLVRHSTDMFDQNTDKDAASKAARKLMDKYGKQALERKAEYLARRDSGRKAGSCVGSRLTCHRGVGYDAPIGSGDVSPRMIPDTN